MRERRRALSAGQQSEAAGALMQHLLRLRGVTGSRRVGAYFACDGEIDPIPALVELICRGQAGYLPVLFPSRRPRLRFARFSPERSLTLNRFDIPEPGHDPRSLLDPGDLDWVFVPLVAFDNYGNRLGMGGGYYDASLASRRQSQAWCRPRLVGLAHEFQRVARLAVDNWDVPLEGVLTELGFHPAATGH